MCAGVWTVLFPAAFESPGYFNNFERSTALFVQHCAGCVQSNGSFICNDILFDCFGGGGGEGNDK